MAPWAQPDQAPDPLALRHWRTGQRPKGPPCSYDRCGGVALHATGHVLPPRPDSFPRAIPIKMGCLSYFGSMELVQKQPFMPFGGPLEVFSTDVTVLWGRGS